MISTHIVSPVLWLFAFLCSLFLINDLQLELFGMAVVLVCVWAIYNLGSKVTDGYSIPKSSVLLFAALFWGLVITSFGWSEIPFVSVMGIGFFSVLPLTFLTCVVCGRDLDFKVIGYVLAAVFAGLGIWAMAQFFFLNDYFMGRAHHPLSNPNSLAALFNLALFCALGWVLYADDRLQKSLGLGLSLILVGGIAATGSKGAFFASIPAFLLFVVFAFREIKSNWQYCLGFGLGAMFIVGLVTLFHDNNLGILERVGDTFTADNPDPLSNRLNIWQGALGIIQDHWVLGTGIGTFFLYYPEYRVPQDFIGAFSAHSDPLQFWAEMGIGGIVLFYAFVVACIGRFFMAVFKVPVEDKARILMIAPFCALTAVIVHTHVTFNLYNLSILFGVGLVLAFWFIQTQKILQTLEFKLVFPDVIPGFVHIGLLIIPFIILLWPFSKAVLSERFVNIARDQIFAGEIEGFSKSIELADTISGRNNYRAYMLAVTIPMAVLEEEQGRLPRSQQKELYDQAIWQLDRAQFLNPRSSSALFYRAKIQTLVDAGVIPEETQSVETYYRQALELDPSHIGARIALMDLYMADRAYEKAVELADTGIDWTYNNPIAGSFYTKAAAAYVQHGALEKHKDAMQKFMDFKKRSDDSRKRIQTSIGQQIFGHDSF